jgi:hypothetical protein
LYIGDIIYSLSLDPDNSRTLVVEELCKMTDSGADSGSEELANSPSLQQASPNPETLQQLQKQRRRRGRKRTSFHRRTSSPRRRSPT